MRVVKIREFALLVYLCCVMASAGGDEGVRLAEKTSQLSSVSSALKHEVLSRCGTTQARVCKLALPHYTCDTPMFMPVGTCGAVKGMTTEELEELDCHLILGNTYHLALRPGTGSFRVQQQF